MNVHTENFYLLQSRQPIQLFKLLRNERAEVPKCTSPFCQALVKFRDSYHQYMEERTVAGRSL